MTTSKASKHVTNRSKVLRVFKPGLEISHPEINERIEKMFGEKICGSTLIITIIDLIKENMLARRNGPLYHSSPEGRVEEDSRWHIKLFSLKAAT